MLSAVELERGWVEFKCDSHGFLVATGPRAHVKCACGKNAYAERQGVKLNNSDRKALHLAHSKSYLGTVASRKKPRGRPFIINDARLRSA